MNKQLIISVGLIERDIKFLFTRRISSSNPECHQRWELPGGKIEAGETPEEALHREIFEETHLKLKSSKLLGVYTQHWKIPTGIQQTIYAGQAFHWFDVRKAKLEFHRIAKKGSYLALIYQPMLDRLKQIFDEFHVDGKVKFAYACNLFYGKLKD